jgi:hypothetical protein
METARTFETLVNFYQTTRRYNPEDSHFYFMNDFDFFSDRKQSVRLLHTPQADERGVKSQKEKQNNV